MLQSCSLPIAQKLAEFVQNFAELMKKLAEFVQNLAEFVQNLECVHPTKEVMHFYQFT